MLNLDEVGKKLGISRYTVKAWAEEGKIKYTLKDEDFYFKEEDVEEFMNATNIRYIKPEIDREDIERRMQRYYKENNLMSTSDIETLVKELNK